MSTLQSDKQTSRRFTLSIDTWAVVAAFVAALLIRIGLIKHIAW